MSSRLLLNLNCPDEKRLQNRNDFVTVISFISINHETFYSTILSIHSTYNKGLVTNKHVQSDNDS